MSTITDWNINPNQNWYIQLEDNGSDITVELYSSQSDAEAGSNLVASGSGEYGTDSEVLLTMEESGSPTISFFNSALSYHLKLSGESGDADILFQLYPFVDITEINSSIYRSEDLISRRITKEINEHTHVVINKTLSLPTLIDGLKIQDVLQIDSDFRGKTSSNFVDEINIKGSHNSLICSVGCVEYIDFTR